MDSFEMIHDRKNTRSVKWDMLQTVFQTKDVLPMWVADMDFKAPQVVNDALIKRAEHGIYGYTNIDDALKEAVVSWNQRRHHWMIKQDWLSFSPGVMTSLHIAIQAFTEPNDKVLIQTPVYTPFFNVIESNQRQVVKNPLIKKDNYYLMDFEDLEKKMKQGVKAFILCSPHNPVGRVWTKEELQTIAMLCLKYNVLLLSDEIHGDLVYPGHRHIPVASLSPDIAERTITFMSPSKTFNLAGLQASYTVTVNKEIRDKINQNLAILSVQNINTMGNTALESAYTHGESWLVKLMSVLNSHRQFARDAIEENTKELTVTRSEGTYLLWIDCGRLEMDHHALHQFMIEKARVGLNPGISYGEQGGQFMRMNIACPRTSLEEGLNRIITAVNNR